MRQSELILHTDRLLELSLDDWAHAWLLGRAREVSNNGRRAPSQHRYEFATHVDLQGAIGELILLSSVERSSHHKNALAYMVGHLFHPNGGAGVAGPDLWFSDEDSGVNIGIDAKTFDCAPNKKFLAINNAKHSQLRGQCSAYFCAFVPSFGRYAAISRLVPYSDVENWNAKPLRAGGTPSRNLALNNFFGYFSQEPNLQFLNGATFSQADVIARSAEERCRDAILKRIPTLVGWLDKIR